MVVSGLPSSSMSLNASASITATAPPPAATERVSMDDSSVICHAVLWAMRQPTTWKGACHADPV